MGRITLDNIARSYGSIEVLKDIDLKIDDGELVVFVGPSGCGKSTLLRLIAGLDKPTGGEIRIDGETVNRVPAADRGLAMVFQSYALYPHMSVKRNMAFGLENSHMPRQEIEARIAEAARMLEIEPYLDRRPGQLSGGQRQRVAIGRAIVRNPTAFLLDEPLSNLDAELRVSMRAEIASLHSRLKTTMIYVTHDQVEAMTLANRIVVMRKGRIEQVDTPLNLFNKPANLFVAGFIGAPNMNFFEGTVEEALPDGVSVSFLDGQNAPVKAAPDAARPQGPVTLGIRPQHLHLAREGEPKIPVQVSLVEALGTETVVHATTGNGTRVLAVLPGQPQIAKGDALALSYQRDLLHAFNGDGERLAGN